MHIKLPHSFTRAEAKERVRRALREGKPQLEGKVAIQKEEWVDDTLHFAFTGQGQHISGTLEVKDAEFIINAKLPLMLRFFEKQIEDTIQKETERLLG